MKKKIIITSIILSSISLFIVFLLDNGNVYVQNEAVDKGKYLINVIFESTLIAALTGISVVIVFLSKFSMYQETYRRAKYFIPAMCFSFSILNFGLCEIVFKILVPSISVRFLEQFQAIFYCLFFILFFEAIYYAKKGLLSKLTIVIFRSMYFVLIVLSFISPREYFFLLQILGLSITMIILVVLFWVSYARVIKKEKKNENIVECLMVMLILFFVNVFNANMLLNVLGEMNSMKIVFLSAFLFLLFWIILIAYRVYLAELTLKETEEELQAANYELVVHQNEILATYEAMELEIEYQTKDLQKANEQLEREIAQRKQSEREIERLAYYDQLTNIPNRRYFKEYVENLVYDNSKDNKFSLLYMDLDGFKKVNDTYGHTTGDQLLTIVGESIKKELRPDDFLGRLGGDEFAAVLVDLDDRQVIVDICEKIRNRIIEKTDIEGKKIRVDISIGIARFSEDALTMDELIIKADRAMYEAKKDEGSNFAFSSELVF